MKKLFFAIVVFVLAQGASASEFCQRMAGMYNGNQEVYYASCVEQEARQAVRDAQRDMRQRSRLQKRQEEQCRRATRHNDRYRDDRHRRMRNQVNRDWRSVERKHRDEEVAVLLANILLKPLVVEGAKAVSNRVESADWSSSGGSSVACRNVVGGVEQRSNPFRR